MKFDCGETWDEKVARLEQWHPWFAWRPVRLGSHDCRWLEWLVRKGKYTVDWGGSQWNWRYMEKLPPST